MDECKPTADVWLGVSLRCFSENTSTSYILRRGQDPAVQQRSGSPSMPDSLSRCNCMCNMSSLPSRATDAPPAILNKRPANSPHSSAHPRKILEQQQQPGGRGGRKGGLAQAWLQAPHTLYPQRADRTDASNSRHSSASNWTCLPRQRPESRTHIHSYCRRPSVLARFHIASCISDVLRKYFYGLDVIDYGSPRLVEFAAPAPSTDRRRQD